MSSAAAAVPADAAPPAPAGRKKKLIVIGVGVLLVLLIAAAAGAWWLKSRAAKAAELAEAGEDGPALMSAKADASRPPTFLPLDPFVVNLADKEADRYAQIGITLEVENGAFADQMKAYMPAVRNAILLIIAHKTSRELLDRSGKENLAEEIMREAVRPMGIEIAAPRPVTLAAEPAASAASDAASAVVVAAASAPAEKPKRRAETQKNPIQHVHFSSFIVQ